MPVQTPIRGLRSFCIAAKCLSFKHAATQLYITPSAVSHQIKQLEDQLGTQLFKRSTRAIELTSAGNRFYNIIKPIITELETSIADFTESATQQTITVSLPEFFASELFVPKLSEWADMHPDINLQLETVKSGLSQAKAADLSIILATGKPNASIVHELFPVRYVPACSKKLYKKCAGRGFDILKELPLILHQARPWSWHKWADQQDIANFEPKQIIQFDSMFGVARAAQQSMGIALVPLPIAKTWFQETSLVKLFEQELVTNDRYFLVQHADINASKELTLFSDWVKTNFQDLR
ncbi:LysR family transcriptional regulator [Thalassotalea sp. PLHSN55]|uniref:LysR family transcriptional regulator n=1 Tax=Thalassotalea sp. PLHSN55 TaxID=3435888 RepID=UPI003F8681D7